MENSVCGEREFRILNKDVAWNGQLRFAETLYLYKAVQVHGAFPNHPPTCWSNEDPGMV